MNKNVLSFKHEDDAGSTSSGESAVRTSGPGEQRRRELADFLRTRREKIKPEHVGLAQGSRRRTPGLRREEVAELAGVGTTWYTWLEQARDIQPSSEVLRRLGLALQLNSAEMRHLFILAGKALPMDLNSDTEELTETMKRFLNNALHVPAVVVGARWDILGMNAKAEEVFTGAKDLDPKRRNWIYMAFCQSHIRKNDPEWQSNARRLLAEFRASLGEALDNPWVQEIVELLKKESPEFNSWWREHDVRDNDPVIVEMGSAGGTPTKYERLVLRPWDQTRFRVLIFTPL